MTEKQKALANIEAEQALLGVLLVNNRAFHRVSSYLRAEHFFVEVHQRIYKAIADAIAAGRFVDARVLKPAFDQDPALESDGGGIYLGRLCAGVSVTDGAESYAQQIYDLAQRRALVDFSKRLKEYASDLDNGITADEIVSRATRKLVSLTKSIETGIGKRALAERIAQNIKRELPIYSTGLPTIDECIGGGIVAGKHYCIGARKKTGKSRLCASISHNLNKAGVKHGFLTLEMTDEEIEQCNIGREKGFNSFAFISNRGADWISRMVGEYAAEVPDNTIFEYRPGADFNDLRRIFARWKQRGLTGAFLDCLQLVMGRQKNQTEEQHIREVADWITAFCRREEFWVVSTAQLNQEGNIRGGEGPRLACDMYFTFHRDKDESGGWLEMGESRFTKYQHVGSPSLPGIWLHSKGPHFSSDPPSASELERAAEKKRQRAEQEAAKKAEKAKPKPVEEPDQNLF